MVKKTNKLFEDFVKKLKKEADIIQVKRAIVSSKKYVPHLRIVIEPQKEKGLKLEMQGPFVFDMTAKIIPIDNYLKETAWSSIIPEEIEILKPKRSVAKTIDYAVKKAKNNLKQPYYKSTIMNINRSKSEDIHKLNLEYLEIEAKAKETKIKIKASTEKNKIQEKINSRENKITALKRKHLSQKTKRLVKKVIKKSNLLKKTKEMQERENKINGLKKEILKLKSKIKKIDSETKNKIQKLYDKAKNKARVSVKRVMYRPSRKDMLIKATILLIPTKRI